MLHVCNIDIAGLGVGSVFIHEYFGDLYDITAFKCNHCHSYLFLACHYGDGLLGNRRSTPMKLQE